MPIHGQTERQLNLRNFESPMIYGDVLALADTVYTGFKERVGDHKHNVARNNKYDRCDFRRRNIDAEVVWCYLVRRLIFPSERRLQQRGCSHRPPRCARPLFL